MINRASQAIMRAYWGALRLYPAAFQAEYAEEMFAVFSETCWEAGQTSTWALARAGWLELRDLPTNLIREHWANLRKQLGKPSSGLAPSLTASVMRWALWFAASFFAVYLAFALVDSLSNLGQTIGSAQSGWTARVLHPTALGCGAAAFLLCRGAGSRRAVFAALAIYIAYMLVAIIGYPLMHFTSGGFLEYMLYPFLYMACVGVLVGGGIGLFHPGRKQVSRFGLAGMAGFVLGWWVDRGISAYLIVHSQYHGYLSQLVLGSPLYFVYVLLPVILFGLLIGTFLGMAAYHKEVSQPLET
jgi:hypothetical protein